MKKMLALLSLFVLTFNMCFAGAEELESATYIDQAAVEKVVVASAGITITKQPEDVTTAAGTEAAFEVKAEGEGLKYQWEYMPNSTWMNHGAASATSAKLTFTARDYQSGYKYRCVVTDANGNRVTTEEAVLTIGVPSEFTVDEIVYRLINETTVEVVRYQGSAAAVTVPEIVQGYSVTAIGESAFEGNVTLRSIDLPDTITVISKRAFANCTNLSSMN